MAKYYDAMYSWKDYEAESQRIHEIIQKYKTSAGVTLLDVGCGTGGHIEYLRLHYEVSGLDLSEAMLKVAREKYNDVEFFQANMTNMSLDRKFDVITSLFGSIGHLTTQEQLEKAIHTFSRHTKSGGIVVIEPFVTEESVHPKSTGILCLDQPDIKIARVNASKMEGNVLYLNFHFLIATDEKVEHLVDPSPMGIFPRSAFTSTMEESGFTVNYVEPGLMERTGIFVGVKE